MVALSGEEKKLTPTVQSNVRRMGSAIHSDTMVEEENFRNPPP